MRVASSLFAIFGVVHQSRVEASRLDSQDAPFQLLTNLRSYGPVQPNTSSAFVSWALPSGHGDQESFGLELADSVTGKILLEQNGTSAAPSTDLVISEGLLQAMHAYKWRVSACMTRGECLPWSDWASFTTGWSGEPDAATSTPMWMEGADGFVLFRREIEVSFRQDVVLALAGITANPQTTHGSGVQNAKLLASYKLYLDGALVGMGPGRVSTCGPVCPIQDATTECSCEPHHLYDVYDVTALVTQGASAGRQRPASEQAQMKVPGQSAEKGDGAIGPWGTEGQLEGELQAERSQDGSDSAPSTMVVALQTYMSRNYGEDGPIPPKVLLQLDLVLRNGTRISVGSGPSFKAYNATDYFNPSCCASAYKQDQYQPHDNFDARQEPVGWRQAGFNDSSWEQAVPAPGWWAPLRPRPSNNVLVTHGLQPQDIRQYPSSHTLDLFVDFGLEFMGGMDVAVDAPPGSEGTVLDVSMTEDLLPGTAWPRDLKVPMHTGNDYHEQWTLRAGSQRFTQHEYSEFRFARIRVLPGLNASQQAPPPASSFNISAWRVRYDADYTGTEFEAESGNATLAQAVTRVHGLSRDTQVTTTIDMFTDSNTRQRDVMCGENININSRMGWASSLEFMVQRQSLEYGIQQRGWGGPRAAEWPMIMVISTYQDYMRTGLLDLAERHYATLRNWTGTALVNQSSGLWSCPPCGGLSRVEHCTANVTLFSCNGPEIDWPSNLRDGFVYRPENTVVNAFSYRALVSFEALARALNRSQDADRAAAAASRMRRAAQTLLLPDPGREGEEEEQQLADGFIDGAGTPHQAWHSTVFAMLHGLADGLEEEQQAALRGMVLRRMEEQDGIVGGVYLGPWALTVLFQNVTDHGHAGVKFMAAAGPHSWLHQLSLNATAGMEAWDPSEKPNLTFSHPWGAPLVWVVAEYLMGVKATAPGFATFEVRPQLGALTRASLVVPSIRGPIPVDVNQTLQQEPGELGRRTGGASGLAPAGFSVRVEVPGSCRAVVYAPVASRGSEPTRRRVEVDGQRLGEVELELEQPHEQYAVVTLEPGVHVVRTGAHVLA